MPHRYRPHSYKSSSLRGPPQAPSEAKKGRRQLLVAVRRGATETRWGIRYPPVVRRVVSSAFEKTQRRAGFRKSYSSKSIVLPRRV